MSLPDNAGAARRLGLKRYFTGKPCMYGHIAERIASNHGCAKCRTDVQRRYRAKYPERSLEAYRKQNQKDKLVLRERARARYRADPQKGTAASRKWRAANPGKASQITRAWQIKNPDKARAHQRNRNARKLNVGGKHTAAEVAEIMKAQKGKCAYCKKRLLAKWHVDHVIPLTLNGRNDRRNLQVLCQSCNLRKQAKHPIIFAQSLGLLL